MALESIVLKQYPFDSGYKEIHKIWGSDSFGQGYFEKEMKLKPEEFDHNNIDQPPGSNGVSETGGNTSRDVSVRRKRKHTKSPKNEAEMEHQRMTHIAVERNRRRLMNDYLSVLRSLMPPSYSQRGDQASIVGGAINFVKELEQCVQFLEANNQKPHGSSCSILSKLFPNYFTFPQYSTTPSQNFDGIFSNKPEQKLSTLADIEVSMAENHSNIKLLTLKRPKQLLIIVAGLQSLSLQILHLSITTVDQMVLYSFIVKVNDESQLNSVNDIATAVHELVRMIEEASC